MNTKKIIIIIAVALAIIALALFFFTKNKSTTEIPNETTRPTDSAPKYPIVSGKKPSITSEKFDITTPSKETVAVNNIYKLPDTKPLSEDGVNFKNSDYYYMAYYPKQQGYIIAITNPDLEKARQLAESDFLNILNITKDQACKLNVSLTVPSSVGSKASGGNYGLSFCPKGKPFPKQ